jgi:8-hydroxy-5-deazaflavin:NADPH oxidoreductase
VLGSGIVGQVLGSGFAKYGHEVKMGTREPGAEEVRQWLARTPSASAGTLADAARFGELIVLAVQGRLADKVVDLAGAGNFAGKIVIDCTNPLADAPPENGVLRYTTGPNESLGEQIQTLLPDAHVVKAFNSVGNTRMVNPHFDQGVPTMFLCGDDETAKAQVSNIIREFGWEPGSHSTAVESSRRGRSNPSACCGAYQGS